MPDPQTPNLQLYIPLNGADVGTWDVPMNANSNTLDAALGQTATIPVTNVSVLLSPAQYACGTIIVTGIQTADLGLVFPNFGRFYQVLNLCTNNNTWVVFLQNVAGVQAITAPPGEMITAYTDGTNFRYCGLGPHVGGYWDYAGSAVPRWVSMCTVPPFLNCDGSAFNAATYPVLNQVLGAATLPDLRGRARYTLNQGTGRLTAINGNAILSAGGANSLVQANLPNVNFTESGLGHDHPIGLPAALAMDTPVVGDFIVNGGNYTFVTATSKTAVSVNSGGTGTAYIPPSIVGGITMIRAG